MSAPLAAALSAIDGYLAANPNFPNMDTVRARCRAMLRAYDAFWQTDNQKYEVLSAEELITGPVVNPATGKVTDYLAAGKIDVMIRERRTGHVGIIDHKALASAIDDDQHEHLLIDPQPMQYALLKHLNGLIVQIAVWDCLVKTQHRIKQESSKIVTAAREERVASRKTTLSDGRVYLKGQTVPAQAEVRETTPGETPQEFEDRLVAIYLAEPEKFFLRKRIPVLKSNVYEHAQEMFDWTMLIDSAHKTGKTLKNAGACFEYNRPCKFLGICSGRSDPNDKSQWVQIGSKHNELDLAQGIEHRKVITNSRLKVFKSCQRKHYFQYELGLQKNVEQPDEPLYVGSCVHAGLEFYFKSLGGLD